MQVAWSMIIVSIIVLVILIALAWWILSRLYERASTEVSFVRTGFMGRRVVVSGGAIVVPVLHKVVRVGLNTIRLSTTCRRQA